MAQLKLEFPEEDVTPKMPSVHNLKAGDIFIFPEEPTQPYMKIHPTGFLNNSRVITDVIARGDCMIVMLSTGILRYVSGALLIKPISATLKINK